MPELIWEPFRQPTNPFRQQIIRPLFDVLNPINSKQNLSLRLPPRTLSAIISLVLHAQWSARQQRVLHHLIEAVRECHQILRSSLLQETIKTISNPGALPVARWTAAQILRIIVHARSGVHKDLKGLGNIILSTKDYVLRYLVADVFREVLHNGAPPDALWPDGAQQIHDFPVQQNTSTAWLGDVRDYFSAIDQSHAFQKV